MIRIRIRSLSDIHDMYVSGIKMMNVVWCNVDDDGGV